jgi:L-rhamnose isomerase
MKDKNPPNRIYCDTYLGNPMYSYTNHHGINTRIEYIRADYVNDALEQLKLIEEYLNTKKYQDNDFLISKINKAINHLQIKI